MELPLRPPWQLGYGRRWGVVSLLPLQTSLQLEHLSPAVCQHLASHSRFDRGKVARGPCLQHYRTSKRTSRSQKPIAGLLKLTEV